MKLYQMDLQQMDSNNVTARYREAWAAYRLLLDEGVLTEVTEPLYRIEPVMDHQYGEPIWDRDEIDAMIAAGALVQVFPEVTDD